MHGSTAQEAIRERIGHRLADPNEDIATELPPERMGTLLDPSHTRHANDINTLCALIAALMHPELYRFIDRNGELFLQPITRAPH